MTNSRATRTNESSGFTGAILPPFARAPQDVDLAAVQATDARRATVTTADGRALATEDGDRTWMPHPLQEF